LLLPVIRRKGKKEDPRFGEEVPEPFL